MYNDEIRNKNFRSLSINDNQEVKKSVEEKDNYCKSQLFYWVRFLTLRFN